MNNFQKKPNPQILMYKCRVTKVYPERFAVDIYIPEINSEYRSVALLANNIQALHGAVTMPDIDSVGIIVLYHQSFRPVMMGFMPGYDFSKAQYAFETVLAGEHRLTSKGLSSLKLDSAGSAYLANGNNAGSFLTADNQAITLHESKSDITPLSKKHLMIKQENDIISLTEETIEYKDAVLPSYPPDTFIQNGVLNQAAIDKVISDATYVIQQLNDNEDFFAHMQAVKENMFSLTEEDMAQYQQYLEEFRLTPSSPSIRVKKFTDDLFSFGVYDKTGVLIAGIDIDEDGAHQVGKWGA